ncbi:MAG: coat protein, partial [Gammaproteobacteria bacterium]|nr:coat protein [Gammaproteobacteria bacterium]
MSTNETQVITAALDEVVKTFEEVTTLSDRTQPYEPNPGSMQRSSDQYVKPIQQNANVVEGKDISGETPDGMLELSMIGSMGDYSNIWRTIASHDMRDERTLRHSMKAGAMALAGDMEYKGLAKAATHGAFCKQFSQPAGEGLTNTSVWQALAESETRMFDSEMCVDAGVTAFLNGTTYTAGGQKLVDGAANRSNRIADDAYLNGQIQNQIAGVSEVFRHNKLLRLTAAAATGVTVTGTQTFKPEATFDLPGGSSGNVDHRFAALTVSDTTDIKVGDKFTFPGVKAVALGTTKQVQ